MSFIDPLSEEPPTAPPPRRHELLVEILKLLTPTLSLVVLLLGLNAKYAWLSKPWVLDGLILLAALVLIWFAQPRFSAWLRGRNQRKREQQFVTTNDIRLRELIDQFGELISTNNTRSFLYILRSGFSQNMTAVEQVLSGDYIGAWFHAYREQLAFPANGLRQFLARCREFGNIVQQFNTYYVLRAQRQLAVASAPLPDHSIAELESFREDYNAFLRNVESWAKGVSTYLQSCGVTAHPALWQLAPTTYFERPKSFEKTKSAGG
jgi:hypothetical protein